MSRRSADSPDSPPASDPCPDPLALIRQQVQAGAIDAGKFRLPDGRSVIVRRERGRPVINVTRPGRPAGPAAALVRRDREAILAEVQQLWSHQKKGESWAAIVAGGRFLWRLGLFVPDATARTVPAWLRKVIVRAGLSEPGADPSRLLLPLAIPAVDFGRWAGANGQRAIEAICDETADPALARRYARRAAYYAGLIIDGATSDDWVPVFSDGELRTIDGDPAWLAFEGVPIVHVEDGIPGPYVSWNDFIGAGYQPAELADRLVAIWASAGSGQVLGPDRVKKLTGKGGPGPA